jgi:hypothetical protein
MPEIDSTIEYNGATYIKLTNFKLVMIACFMLGTISTIYLMRVI